MAEEQKAPYVFIRHRETEGTLKRSVRVVRYWKHKETGTVVEIRRMMHVADANYLRVVYFDPLINRTVSVPLKQDRPDPFDPSRIERAFEKDFEPYGNFSDRV